MTVVSELNTKGAEIIINGTIEVKNGTTMGKFTINAAASGQNIALITCAKLIEGGTFSGKPEVIE